MIQAPSLARRTDSPGSSTLIQKDRRIYAVKLPRLVFYRNASRTSHSQSCRPIYPTIGAILCMTRMAFGVPRNEPWRECGRPMNIIHLAQAIEANGGEHYRSYLMGLRRMYRDGRIVTSAKS